MSRNEQEHFWADTYVNDYIDRNHTFDRLLALTAWRQMLRSAEGIETILECGSNIGRNISFLREILPNAGKSIIEIGDLPYSIDTKQYELEHAFHGSILDSNLPSEAFDLVFTTSVLIHIHPDNLLANMQRMFEYSRRYILIGEYFNRTPVMIEYRGEGDRLFKSDFGKTFVSNFPVRVVDYGFLWGHEFDEAGFDDVTWWLFEK